MLAHTTRNPFRHSFTVAAIVVDGRIAASPPIFLGGSNAAPLEGQLRKRCNTPISHLHLKSVNESSQSAPPIGKAPPKRGSEILTRYFTVIVTDFEVIAPELSQFFTTM